MRQFFRVCAVAMFATACGPRPSGIEIPLGTDVTIERRDGTTAGGTLTFADANAVVVGDAHGAQTRIARQDIAAVQGLFRARTAVDPRPAAEPDRRRRGKAPPAPRRVDATPASTAAAPAFRDYRVPAGTLLAIELRSTLTSMASRPQDPVRGRLRRALIVNGVELVPEGATVLGTVTDVTQAVREPERSRIAVRFNILEHPGTGSRVSLKTVELAFLSPAAVGRRLKPDAPDTQVRLAPGVDVSASLLEPFTVRIPGRS